MIRRYTPRRRGLTRKSEHSEQCLVVAWCKLQGILIYAIPNAARRSKQLGKRLKDEGMLAGVPDLCIPYPRDKFGALYIEMKYKDGKSSESQINAQEALRYVGNKVCVCWSATSAIEEIKGYLGLAIKG